MRLCASGRNLKMSYVAIAQRFQMVTTNIISLSGQLYIGALHEANDLKKIRNWLADKTKEVQYLELGEFFRYHNGKIAKIRTERFRARSQPKISIQQPNTPIILKPKAQPRTRSENTTVIIGKLALMAIFCLLMLKVYI